MEKGSQNEPLKQRPSPIPGRTRMTLGIWGPKDATPRHFLRRCAYCSTRPNKPNFTIELPRTANARLDTRQCRIKRPGLGSEEESSGVVRFHLKPPTSGDAHGFARLIHERPPVLARANETTPLGPFSAGKGKKKSGFKRRREARKEGRRLCISFFWRHASCLFRLTLLVQRLHERIAGWRYEILAPSLGGEALLPQD